jgi:hypothetical protein
MDTSKDLQKTDGIVKFLDYQTLKSNPFGDNRVGERLYKRAERIASAVVLLTNHVDAHDVLRESARMSAVEILSTILAIRDEMRAQNSPETSALKMSVRKTISHIRLLAVAGQISLQNAEIVIEALDELLSFLAASRKSSLSETVSITREDLMDIREAPRFVQEKVTDGAPKSAAVNHPDITAATGVAPQRPVMGTRSQAILEVLRGHGELGIREVAANLPEYSEKMIQRELAELVEAGKVKKTGLKRWSRYTYIQ